MQKSQTECHSLHPAADSRYSAALGDIVIGRIAEVRDGCGWNRTLAALCVVLLAVLIKKMTNINASEHR